MRVHSWLLFVSFVCLAVHSQAADLVWTNTAGGNWNTAANWSPNQVPAAADNAWITNAGTYTVTINSSVIAAALLMGADTGTQTLSLGGTLTGTAISKQGGAALVANGGTLSGVTLAADVSIANNNSLTIANGLTLAGGARITLSSTGGGTWLYVQPGTQTIGGAGEIVLAGSSSANSLEMGQGAATALTFGPGVPVRGRGSIRQWYGSTLANQGTIQADVSGQSLTVTVNSFANSGTLKAIAGTLQLPTTFNQIAGATLLQGGTVASSSTLNFLGGTGAVSASVLSSARVTPGASPGLLTITGSYTQTTNGLLDIELTGLTPGSGFDRLVVGGTASLAGTVNVTLNNGFYPPTSANFSFLTCGSRVGTFSAFNYPSNDVGMMAVYSATNAAAQVINVRPVLPLVAAQTNDELVLFTLNAAGTDDDQPAQTLTYALTNSPNGASINPANGLVSWIPSEAQGPMLTNITVLVTDNGTPNLTVARTFAITVNEINVAPVLSLPPDQPINEEVVFSAQATATDSDIPANSWTFELVSGPPGLNLSPEGALAWTPDEAQGPGVYPVTVRVTDTNPNAVNEQSLSTTNTFTLTVREVNRPPSLTVPAHQVLTEEAPLGVPASASDPDLPANGLVFSLLSPPAGMTINAASGLIEWTPSESQGPGSNVVTVVVTDDSPDAVNARHLSVTNTFTVIVTESNRPPVLTVPTNQVLDELTLLSVSASANDPDDPPNTLAFSLSVAPAGMTIDTNTGANTWTPTEAQGPSSNYVEVVVTDLNTNAVNAQSLSATNSFSVLVSEVNVAPLLTVPADQTVLTGTSLNVSASAADPDLPTNTLTFGLVSPPEGMAIQPTSGAITWAPRLDQRGVHTVVLTVTDDNPGAVNEQHLSATNSFSVTVLVPPTILAQPASRTNECGSDATFAADATSTDPMIYLWFFQGTSLMAAGPSASLVLSNAHFLDAGEYTVVVTNRLGSVSSAPATLTVVDTTPPAISVCPPNRLLSADGSCRAVIPDLRGEVVAADVCGSVTVTQAPPAGTVVGLGPHGVTLTVTDESGNATNCTATVTVADTTPPGITACAPDQVLSVDTNCQAAIPDLTGMVTATDNCGPLSYRQDPEAGTLVGLGVHPVVLTVSDAASTTASCTASVTVRDTTPPIILCPSDVLVTLGATDTEAVVNFDAPVVTDNCSGATVQCTPVSGSRFSAGTNPVVCVATDGSGNTNTCSFNVVVNRAPLAGADAMIAIANHAASVSLDFLLANDGDADGDRLSITAAGPASTNGGAVQITGTHIVYAPATGFSGQDLFRYTLSDALGATREGDVAVTVFPETHPSYNRIAIVAVTPDHVTMTLLGIPGKTYTLERSGDLQNWVALQSVPAPADGEVAFDDPSPPMGGAFYRAVSE